MAGVRFDLTVWPCDRKISTSTHAFPEYRLHGDLDGVCMGDFSACNNQVLSTLPDFVPKDWLSKVKGATVGDDSDNQTISAQHVLEQPLRVIYSRGFALNEPQLS